ncbi:MAG: SecDF P1 head subdomain-containing protein [Acidimicrobiia bacterium]
MQKNKALVIVGVIVTLLAGILNGQTPVEIRAAASSAVSGWAQMTSPGGDPLWVAPDIRLTSADIERAEARQLADGPAVAIVLTTDGARKMAALSNAQMNKPIALLLDGQVIWAPVVRSTVEKEAVMTGGPGGLTQAQIQRLLTSLKK